MSYIWFCEDLTELAGITRAAGRLADGDIAITSTVSGNLYVHTCSFSNTDATNSPSTIRISDWSTYSAGAWVEGVFSASSAAAFSRDDIVGGEITVSADVLTISAYDMLDSTKTIQLQTTGDETCDLSAATANKVFNVYAVKLSADGSNEVRAYDVDGTGVTADGDVSAYRRIDFASSDGASTIRPFLSVNGIHWIKAASDASVQAATAPPADCNTAIDFSDYAPDDDFISEVLPGAQCASSSITVCFGFDGANVHHSITAASTLNSDDDVSAWSAYSNTSGRWMPVLTGSTIYWGDGSLSSTANVTPLIQAYKLRR